MQEIRQIGVFDVADWVWSWRWLALAMVILATIGTFIVLQTGNATTTTQDDDNREYEITLQIYTAGTPVRSLAEIADILSTQLLNDDIVLTSPWATSPVVFRADNREQAVRIVARAEEISDQLTAEVQAQAAALEEFLTYRPVPDHAMSQFIRARAFAQGIEDGLTDVVRAKVVPVAPPSRARTVVLAPALFAVLAFFLIAGGTTFSRGWRRHRLSRVSN